MEVALHRDEEKLHTFRGSQAAKSGIDVYSCSGKLIRRINVCYQETQFFRCISADLSSGTKVLFEG